MMTRTIVLVCVALSFTSSLAYAAPPKADSKPDAKADAGKEKKPRSLTAIQTDVRSALTAEAKSRRAGNNAPDVLRLVDLYLEMATHPKRDKSAMLDELGQQV